MRGIRIGTITTAVAVAALLLSGCASGPADDAPTSSPAATVDSSAGDAIGVVGVWGTEDVQGQPYLTLAEDGTISGTDGCNRLIGTWTAEADTVAFGPIATTQMFCEGVDTWLSAAASGAYTEQQLTLYNASGAQIGTLERSK
ncbi:META domain-containing protein [Plantibacter sp. Mn2098]|uniref:META domain-containing protein n=1 Tax=Plantibacter sp. Mn2098 TaxID=3395266 RepID=UPI003BE26A92